MGQIKNPQTPEDFLNFDLEIGVGSDGIYPLTIVDSPAGEAREEMHFPFDKVTLENQLLMLQNALLRSAGTSRQFLLPEEQKVQDFGRALFTALFTGKVGTLYAASEAEATAQSKGLRLKLRILSPEMATLPWEFLYDPSRQEYICLSRHTPMIRYLELPQPPQSLLVTLPLRILAMIATPANLPSLGVQEEQRRMEKALASLQQRGLVQLTWLPGQTWQAVQQAMLQGPWHIFHFIGHGSFDSLADEGVLAFANEEGQAQMVRASQLGLLLADQRSLRLVVLNSCEGAEGSGHDLFSSTAAILVRSGLPAVLAMQYAISDTAAIMFSNAFYASLAAGLPVDAATSEARKAVNLNVQDTLEWGIPSLFMRSPDGMLFTIKQEATSSSPESPPVTTLSPEVPVPMQSPQTSTGTTPPTSSPSQGETKPTNRLVMWALIVTIIAALIGVGWIIWTLIVTSTPKTPTPTPTPARIVDSGIIVLRGGLFDLDTNAETGSGTDIDWVHATVACPPSNPACGPPSLWEMIPKNGATIVNLGIIDFKGLGPAQMQSYSYGRMAIDGEGGSPNQLVPGDVFAVHTNGDHYAKVKVLANSNGNLEIQWVTYF